MTLRGKNIFLRYPIPEDCDILLKWENDPEVWEAGDNKWPYSKREMENFITEGQSLEKNKQARFMICLNDTNRSVGCVDLFDYDSEEKNVGIGILIYDKKDRFHGYATEAINILFSYVQEKNDIKSMISQVNNQNIASLKLFEKAGFKHVEFPETHHHISSENKLFKKTLR